MKTAILVVKTGAKAPKLTYFEKASDGLIAYRGLEDGKFESAELWTSSGGKPKRKKGPKPAKKKAPAIESA